jgi:hypothetical protein
MFGAENILISIINDPKLLVVFIFVMLWSLFWKGVALWKSAKMDEGKWFIAILLINTVGLLEIIYIFTQKKKFRIFWTIILAIFIILGVVFVVNEKINENQFIVSDNYTRIVYGTSAPDTKTLLEWQADCSAKLGEFNECGSPCDEKAEVCAGVCAYTCEKIPRD